MLLFYGIIFSKLKCFIDILAKTFLQTCGSILLKRNITYLSFYVLISPLLSLLVLLCPY